MSNEKSNTSAQPLSQNISKALRKAMNEGDWSKFFERIKQILDKRNTASN